MSRLARLDENALELLKQVKDYLQKKGISADLSDAVREMYKVWKKEETS